MMRFLPMAWIALLVLLATPCRSIAGEPLDFQEVYELLKSQLPNTPESDLGDAAARGLINHLHPKVLLLPDSGENTPATAPSPEPVSRLFELHYGYLRLLGLRSGDGPALLSAYQTLASTNRLSGLILDLRSVHSDDYAAAVEVADLFFAEPTPLLDWGDGPRSASAKTNAIPLPLAVLVNQETSAAAEALAGALRLNRQTLLMGSATAGSASMYRDFSLNSGHRLRIATQPIKVGTADAISDSGLSPDLTVAVPIEKQLVWIEDPYHVFSGSDADTETAPRPRRRINEADLVRMMRDGSLPDIEETAPESAAEPLGPFIQDPVLARALDFLRGLAIVGHLLRQ